MRNYYRNCIDLETSTGFQIEAESLFYRDGDKMILVDEDFYVELPYNEEIFKFDYSDDFTEDND